MTTSAATTGIGSPSPALPDPAGHFGRFGGRLAPEALMSALAARIGAVNLLVLVDDQQRL